MNIKYLMGGVILLCIISFLSTSSLIYVLYKTNLYSRIGEKLGICKAIRSDETCVQSWTNTIEKLRINVDVAFFGNSITRQSDFQIYFPNKKIINLGYGGNTIKDMLYRIEMVRASHPNKIFLMAGINGLKNLDEENFYDQYSSLVDSLLTIVNADSLYVQSILPISKIKEKRCGTNELIKKRNKIIRKISLEKKCNYLDIHSLYYVNGEMRKEDTFDGIHLKSESYRIWANKLKQYIVE